MWRDNMLTPKTKARLNANTRTRSRFAAHLILTALAVSLLALSINLMSGVSKVHADDTVRCAFPFWFGFAPVFVAQDMGYFEEEGIEVTTVFENDRANVLPAIDSGDLDCTMRTIGEYMSRPRKQDTSGTVIGTIDVSDGADGVVAAPGIDSITDLVGKTFAGEINHPGTVLLQYALAKEGHDISELNLRLIATDDSASVFEDESVAAVATWEPMMSSIVNSTSRTGSKLLLTSRDFPGLITDVIIVRTEDYKANPEKYAKFLRGLYRAVDVYMQDPDKFINLSAPKFSVPAAEMKEALEGVVYTSYEDAVNFMGSGGNTELKEIFDAFNEINIGLKLQDSELTYSDHVDPSTIDGLFDGKTR